MSVGPLFDLWRSKGAPGRVGGTGRPSLDPGYLKFKMNYWNDYHSPQQQQQRAQYGINQTQQLLNNRAQYLQQQYGGQIPQLQQQNKELKGDIKEAHSTSQLVEDGFYTDKARDAWKQHARLSSQQQNLQNRLGAMRPSGDTYYQNMLKILQGYQQKYNSPY